MGMARYALSSDRPGCGRQAVEFVVVGHQPYITGHHGGYAGGMAVSEHQRCGGPGVGAIGMCFTGGFALAMATDPSVVAPVLSQPSLPFAMTGTRGRTIDCSGSDLATVKTRCETEGLKVVGLRFQGDRLAPHSRFQFLHEQLGDAFVAVELDDSTANPEALTKPHSVVTEHLIDEPGQPTRAALDEVLDLFRQKLLTA